MEQPNKSLEEFKEEVKDSKAKAFSVSLQPITREWANFFSLKEGVKFSTFIQNLIEAKIEDYFLNLKFKDSDFIDSPKFLNFLNYVFKCSKENDLEIYTSEVIEKSDLIPSERRLVLPDLTYLMTIKNRKTGQGLMLKEGLEVKVSPKSLGSRFNGWNNLSINTFMIHFTIQPLKPYEENNLPYMQYIRKNYQINSSEWPIEEEVVYQIRDYSNGIRKVKDVNYDEFFDCLMEYFNNVVLDKNKNNLSR